jgi:hypothetical protein
VYLKIKKFWFGIACNTGIEIAQDKCFAFLNSNESIRTNLLFITNQLYLPSMNTIYNDVSNSAFGAPPICVLRIGDFFNTKIAIDQISLKYDDGKFDLNPEGIGIQPMIATVSISFSFIGAHGLAGPVAKLQNALSFNYYANTEMYDERAESTETLDQLETLK